MVIGQHDADIGPCISKGSKIVGSANLDTRELSGGLVGPV